jgi:hypothetical protein
MTIKNKTNKKKKKTKKKNTHTHTNSVVLSPRAYYTDFATATCRRNLVPTFVDREVSRGQHGGSPTVVNLSSLDCMYDHQLSFMYVVCYTHCIHVRMLSVFTRQQKIARLFMTY